MRNTSQTGFYPANNNRYIFWHSAEDFKRLGRPNLFFGVTGGNMDSMVNRYTSDKKIRSNDAYTANGEG
jgi:radical SAM superfamily enzyme YgiQ (UPF0313 family)